MLDKMLLIMRKLLSACLTSWSAARNSVLWSLLFVDRQRKTPSLIFILFKLLLSIFANNIYKEGHLTAVTDMVWEQKVQKRKQQQKQKILA